MQAILVDCSTVNIPSLNILSPAIEKCRSRAYYTRASARIIPGRFLVPAVLFSRGDTARRESNRGRVRYRFLGEHRASVAPSTRFHETSRTPRAMIFVDGCTVSRKKVRLCLNTLLIGP